MTPPHQRPDILILIADQLTTAAMPFHGNEVTRAPAMASLAESETCSSISPTIDSAFLPDAMLNTPNGWPTDSPMVLRGFREP